MVLARHKRHSDMQLYKVLADCMEITEICLSEPKEYDVLNTLIQKLPIIEGKNRHYVERSSDIYQRVCRFMFHGEQNNSSTNRYAHCLREAARQGIKAKKLVEELSHGGVAKFFLRRPSQTREIDIRTKCLYLDRQIKHSRRATFILTLKREQNNIYKVLKIIT